LLCRQFFRAGGCTRHIECDGTQLHAHQAEHVM
jgi:hypothetical protein